MQQSNTYVIIFSIGLTIVLGGLLSSAKIILQDRQKTQVELDTKKKILGAVITLDNTMEGEDILEMYDNRVESMLIDIDGNVIEDAEVTAEQIDIGKNHKRSREERMYPIFKYSNDQGELEAYIIPTFGMGLWDWISGYIALEKDLNTIKGVAFDHKQETPGLGARITEEKVKGRYKGKEIYNGAQLVSVEMVKGEGNTGLTEHQVDGMSGATMTAKGVNQMFDHYLECYEAFFDKKRQAL